MRILIVKLSSLGDVLHTLPVVADLLRVCPDAKIDWVVEASFAGVVRECAGINVVIECQLRQWRKAPWSRQTHQQWGVFQQHLQAVAYDVVIDAQGLGKSAIVSRLAKKTPFGKRFAMHNRTKGSSYEALTRWLTDESVELPFDCHAIERGRLLCTTALHLFLHPKNPLPTLNPDADFGLSNKSSHRVNIIESSIWPIILPKTVMFVHGTSRLDKQWSSIDGRVAVWVQLGQKMHAQGQVIVLPHGNADEEMASHAIAQQLPNATVLPRLGIADVLNVMRGCVGVVGVDSGLSHMAVALGLPHVQIYNFDTAWRTGPAVLHRLHQVAVCAVAETKIDAKITTPMVEVDVVWQAWQGVIAC